jgi:type II secretory pathway component PulF
MPQVKIRKRQIDEDYEFQPPFAFHSGWPYFTIGFGNEIDYFVENLSIMIASGMGVTASLAGIKAGTKNRGLRKNIEVIEQMIADGFPLWKAFEKTKFLPARIIALVKSGEESGRLPEHLNLVTIQQHKERIFISRIRSALLYPGIVLCLAFVVAIGSAWITLPRLVSVFNEIHTNLPPTTRIIIWLGNFLSKYGSFAVPLILLIFGLVVYLIFFYKKTKIIGEYIILFFPGINKLIQGVELARFGYIFGALLSAGIHIQEAMDSVREGTSFVSYRKFYVYLQEGINQGNSFSAIFAGYKHSDRYIPAPMQQLIIAAEQSGKLPETLMKIGQIFEEKTETMSQDLSTILEPVVLIIVGVIVGFIVLGLISPIYGLSNQI